MIQRPEITESEVIFVELNTEVAFYGQPCGVIVANTMALAHSAAAHIDIMYEQMQQQRQPIVSSIYEWIESRDRRVYGARNEENRLPPNQSAPFFEFGSHQRIKGNLYVKLTVQNVLNSLNKFVQEISLLAHNIIFQWNLKLRSVRQTTMAASTYQVRHNGLALFTRPLQNA